MATTPARIATLPDESTVEYAERVIECCRVLDAAGDDVILNARECATMDAFAIVVLATTLARRRLVSEKATRLDPPRSTDAAKLFNRFRFIDLVAGALPQWEAAESVEGRQLRAHDTDYVERVASAASDVSEKDHADAKFAVNLCLLELLTNAFDHSQSPVGCFVAALREQSDWLHLAVADRGIGIPEALRRSLPPDRLGDRTEADADVVVKAVTNGLTSRKDRAGGLGLGNVRQQVATRGGVLHVIAGTALARFGPDLEVSAITMGTSFAGTVVHAFFDPHRTPVAPTEASEVF